MGEAKRIILTTADGSHTIQLKDSGVTYHSTHGAVQESLHIFLKCGLDEALQTFPGTTLEVFEIGFGTGLNAFLTALKVEEDHVPIQYTSFEKFPLSLDEAAQLNYAQGEEEQLLFKKIHSCDWEIPVQITPSFQLTKQQADLSDFNGKNRYHLIYFDAFAPGHQPELWTTTVFQNMFDSLLPGGILVTYCSKSEVRRNMTAAGFVVSKLPGPPGKREILRAVKPR